jgi:hypothetical protein
VGVVQAELKAEGKPLPKTIQEYTELMQEQRRLNPNGTHPKPRAAGCCLVTTAFSDGLGAVVNAALYI